MAIKPGIIRNAQDKVLVIKTKAGDEKAYARIYDRYYKDIYRFVFFKLNTVELAEDVAAEVFFKVWQYIYSGKKVKNLRALFYTTARNMVIDQYRKNKEILLNDFIEPRSEYVSDNPETRVIQKQELADLQHALSRLKEEHSEIVVLRHMHELSFNEIADITGKRANAVRVILHRAVKELKKDFPIN
jgi:RNA polymerase sigma-70 factor, ECF subfamily